MKTNSGLRLAIALALPFQITAAAMLFPTEIAAKTPSNTSLSRALGAVLVPVNAETIKKFKIKTATSGMMIVSMQPDGVAKDAGFLPGDVISKINGMTITDLVTLDEIAFFALDEDVTEFTSDGFRDGKAITMTYSVTWEEAFKPLDFASIATWTFYDFDGFDYVSFYAEYSVELTESYELSETIVEDYSVEEEGAEDMAPAEDEAEAADDAEPEAEAEGEGEAEGEAEGGDEGGEAESSEGDAG